MKILSELDYFSYFFVFIVGLSVGSFLNVVIYRLPVGLSIITPRSRCSHCKSPIKFYYNIPLLSYLLLGGRCAICKVHISLRYPLVELCTALLSLSLFFTHGISYEYLFFFILASILIAVSFIDIDYQIIPDEIIIVGLVVGFLYPIIGHKITFINSILGGLSGFLSLYILSVFYTMITGRIGLGGGDMKLMGVVGLFLGPFATFTAIMVGSFIGVFYSFILILMKRIGLRQPIPYGPFLSLGTLFVIFN